MNEITMYHVASKTRHQFTEEQLSRAVAHRGSIALAERDMPAGLAGTFPAEDRENEWEPVQQTNEVHDRDVVALMCGYDGACDMIDVMPDGAGLGDESWYIIPVVDGFPAPGFWATWSDESAQFAWHETRRDAEMYWESAAEASPTE